MNQNPASAHNQAALLDETTAAVTAAAAIIRRDWQKPKDVRHKGRIDLVTETDLAMEEELKQRLGGVLPQAGFQAEETGSGRGDSEWLWIIDPLDGTTNFAHGLPGVAVSVALWQGSSPVLGVVHAPRLEETFTALSGGGAWLNGARIGVSRESELEQSLVATGFPYDITERLEEVMPPFRRVLARCRGIRRMGAAAIDLAYTACGRFEGFFEAGLKPWDTAAGWLLVQEAGGMVTRFDPQLPHALDAPDILATNGGIHASLARLLLP